ncbi:hypothetical protein E5720_01450 [Rhodococcus sp. PAMC28707]|uniref:hypothetical protein n=1 Tax=unclassified Rhodococcus (in: high G+C Gram-positive bacteria) TaxID=192944 RepID=UPI00109DB40E|nr:MULTISPECIES: hypothetical protein [unclassified Rhodococcus (in: high G+C Gram-positive bacteria)]QCB50946.1 hypothetical protein E5769_12565 [Rhodococcus sp. PAMC28705]QCB57362.1 hypothetical protein E5720_01450 [Rhodococcus sp. PAMC28707]
MRSIVIAGALSCVLLGAAPAGAAPEVRSAQFETYCSPVDPGLEELSGLTSIDGVLYAIGDSGTDHRLAVLDEQCAVVRWLDVPVDPYDVEDLASHGGRLWLSDTGDNRGRRDTIAITGMDPSTGAGELHRLTYPDGPHDAETLLIEPSGRPVVVTKELSGVSGIYVPVGDTTVDQLPSPGPTPLQKVGELAFERTATPGGPAFVAGSILATGGAISADGTVVAVRTYNDLYLFGVHDGDIVEALDSDPVVVAAPQQPQGEAIAFDSEGNLLIASEAVASRVVGSEAAAGPLPPIQMLRGATDLVVVERTDTQLATAGAESDSKSRWVLGAMAVAGVLVLLSVGYGVRTARRR